MQSNFFRALFGSLLASPTLLIVFTLANARGLNLPQWLGLAAALLPLAYYHLVWLTPAAKAGLSQAAVDSVYYFGFLITVAALGVSALTIAISGAAVSMNTVIYQFG